MHVLLLGSMGCVETLFSLVPSDIRAFLFLFFHVLEGRSPEIPM